MADIDNKVIELLEKFNKDGTVDYSKVHELMDLDIVRIIKFGQGCSRTIHTLCYFLCHEKKKENIWKIFEAKSINMDTWFSIDANWLYLCCEFIEETFEYVINFPKSEEKNRLVERIIQDKENWLTQDKVNEFWKNKPQVEVNHILYG
jgi:hypothetical protein